MKLKTLLIFFTLFTLFTSCGKNEVDINQATSDCVNQLHGELVIQNEVVGCIVWINNNYNANVYVWDNGAFKLDRTL